jgi:hypothetical protein
MKEMTGMAEKPTPGDKKAVRMMRVSTEFADAVAKVSQLENLNAAEFVDTHFLPIVRKRYKEAIIKEAKRLAAEK